MRFIIFAVLTFLLSACIASGRDTGSLPASATVPASSPAISPGGTSTIAPTAVSTLTPYPTLVPPSLILADFPLSVGARWKYSEEISYQDPKDYNKLVSWSGFIMDKVVDKKTTPDGGIVFTLQEDLQPPSPDGVWRQSGTLEYTVSGDGVFKDDRKIYQWPLSDNMSWKAFSDFGYDTVASYSESVSTPYGELKGCYTFLTVTNPDTAFDTFCPKIGFVEHSYSHHGTPQVEHFMLVSYQPGQ
jgi:hypothetical protein